MEELAAAAAVTLPLFRTGLAVANKAGGNAFDPVTAADHGAEAAIRRLIAQRFPAHRVIGEEYGEDRPDAEFTWVLDPVDGARAFVAGIPLWAHLIGLRYQGQPVMGLIGQPYLQEVFLGVPSGSRLIRELAQELAGRRAQRAETHSVRLACPSNLWPTWPSDR